MYNMVLGAVATSPFTYLSPLRLKRGHYFPRSTSFQSSLQDTRKSSAVKTLLIWTAAGTGIGGGIGGFLDLATLSSDTDTRGTLCYERICTLWGAAIGGSAGALLGGSKAILESESPSAVERSFAVGMLGLVLGAGVGVAAGVAAEIAADEAVEAGEEPNFCIDNDCTLLMAKIFGGLGTVAGVVLGAISAKGAKEGDARNRRFDVGFYPQRNSGFAMRALVRF